MLNATRSFPVRLIAGLLFILTGFGAPLPTAAQSTPEPTREKLLNGMAILYWPRPGDPVVLLKLRIHSGAAFDLNGKGGQMALLGDALFPDPATYEYVKAILTIQLSADNMAKVRQARLAKLTEVPVTVSQIADLAIAERLLGSYPYAHPAGGTAESVQKVDLADLMLARERFLNADNATLAVIGGVEKGRLMRALRQLLGPWNKSDRTVPATFRQPDPPRANVLLLNQPSATSAELRVAVRGLARADRDAVAALLLARIIKERWLAAQPDLSVVEVRSEAYSLPGIFVLAASTPSASAGKALAAAQVIMGSLSQNGPTVAELDRARSALVAERAARTSQSEEIADQWLDIESFRLASHVSQPSSIAGITPADVQRVATRLFKDAPAATVVVGKSDELKPLFDRPDSEIRLKANEKPPSPPVSPAKQP